MLIVFFGASAFIGVGALIAIFVLHIKPQFAAPVAGIATIVNVMIFGKHFDSANKEAHASMATQCDSSPLAQESSPSGIIFLRVVLVVALLAIAGGLFTDFWGTLPQAVFGLALAFYVFGRINNRLRS